MVISMGLGADMSGIWRRELNTRSSTEADILGIDNALNPSWGGCTSFMHKDMK